MSSRNTNSLLASTALSAIIGLNYGREAYAQGVLAGDLTASNTSTVELVGAYEFVTADGFSVDTTGTGGNGITITTPSGETDDTVFNDQNASIITGAMDGVYADNDGTGALSITTSGDVTGQSVYGIVARNYGTDLTINAATATGGVFGINANNYGTGALSVTTSGDVTGQSVYGISARNYGTDLTITANNVTGRTDGIYADNDGTGALSITTTGAVTGTSDDGIYVHNSSNSTGDVTITINDANGAYNGITVNSFGSGALYITAKGAVTGGTADGINAYNASSEGTTITINAGGSVSTSGMDPNDWAIEATSPNGAVIINNFGTVTGRVNLTNSNTFTNSGTWDLAGTTSDFNATGDSTVENSGLIIAARDSAADETSVINNLDIFRNNAGGTIRLADGNAGDIFRIGKTSSGTANFVANGGTVALDVVLGGDGSASDRLVVDGSVTLGSAPTALAFTSAGGGTGGETTTGIEVVTVGGSSDAGAFVLAGLFEVGAIAYELSLGQCDDTADANWYLCNNGTIGTTGAIFEAMPGVILNSFARTDALQQRLGSRITGARGTISTQGAGDLPVDQAVGPWMRTWGEFAYITPDNSSAGTSWEADSWGLEAGIGTMMGNPAGGDLVAGVNIRYGATYADLSTPVGTGSINFEGFGVAASLTWFGNDGFYVDANGAVDFVSIDATSQGGGELLNDYDDVVYSASAELGKRIELDGGRALVPQARLSWGKMGDGQLTDNLGNVISFADRETLTSRIGLTVEQDVTDTAWGSGKVYGFGNVLNDLSGSRSVTVAGTNVTQSGAGDWVELGGGFSLQPTAGTNIFGQVSYREAFDGVSGDAISMSAGWKMQW